jgi:hypothetical protein
LCPAKIVEIKNIGGVGERFNPPVLKTGIHSVDREFKSPPSASITPFYSWLINDEKDFLPSKVPWPAGSVASKSL